MASPILDRYREIAPSMKGLSDEALAEKLRENFYPEADPEQFKANVGVTRDITQRPIDRYRAQAPQTWGMSDQDLVGELYSQFGDDRPVEEYARDFGVDIDAGQEASAPAESTIPQADRDAPGLSRRQNRAPVDQPQADVEPSGVSRRDRRDPGDLPTIEQPEETRRGRRESRPEPMTLGEITEQVGDAVEGTNLRGTNEAFKAGTINLLGMASEGIGLSAQRYSDVDAAMNVDLASYNIAATEAAYERDLEQAETQSERRAVYEEYEPRLESLNEDLSAAVDEWQEREPSGFSSFTRDFGETLQSAAAERLQDEDVQRMPQVAQDIFSAGGSSAPFFVSAIAGSLATKTARPAFQTLSRYVPALTLAVSQGASEQYQRAKRAGLSEEEAVAKSIEGYAPGALQIAPIASLLKPLPAEYRGKAIGQLIGILRTGGSEALAEGGGVTLQNLIEQSYNPDRGTWDDTAYNAAIGFGVGSGTQALVQTATDGQGLGADDGADTIDGMDFGDLGGPATDTPNRPGGAPQTPIAIDDQSASSEQREQDSAGDAAGAQAQIDRIDAELGQIAEDVIAPARDPDAASPDEQTLREAQSRRDELIDQRRTLIERLESAGASDPLNLNRDAALRNLDAGPRSDVGRQQSVVLDITSQANEAGRQASQRREELRRAGVPADQAEADPTLRQLTDASERLSEIGRQAESREAEQTANNTIDSGRSSTDDALGLQVQSIRQEAEARSPLRDEIEQLRELASAPAADPQIAPAQETDLAPTPERSSQTSIPAQVTNADISGEAVFGTGRGLSFVGDGSLDGRRPSDPDRLLGNFGFRSSRGTTGLDQLNLREGVDSEGNPASILTLPRTATDDSGRGGFRGVAAALPPGTQPDQIGQDVIDRLSARGQALESEAEASGRFDDVLSNTRAERDQAGILPQLQQPRPVEPGSQVERMSPEPTVRANGQPFATQSSVRRSAPFRNAADPEIVSVGDGFGFIDRGQGAQADASSTPTQADQSAQASTQAQTSPIEAFPAAGTSVTQANNFVEQDAGRLGDEPAFSRRDDTSSDDQGNVTQMRNPRDEARYNRNQIVRETAYQIDRLIRLESEDSAFNRSRIARVRSRIDELVSQRDAIDRQYPELAVTEQNRIQREQETGVDAPDSFTEGVNRALESAVDDFFIEDLSARIEEQGESAIDAAVNDLEEIATFGVSETMNGYQVNDFEREIIRQRARQSVESALEGDQTPSFSRPNERTGGLELNEAMGYVDGLMSDWQNAPEVTVAQNESDLPAGLQDRIDKAKARGKIRGVIVSGRIYIIADNNSSRAEVEETLFHEVVRHYGMREVLGDNYNDFMDQVYMKVGRRSVEPFAEYNGLDLDAENASERARARRMATEELLAHTTEAELGSRLWTRLVNLVTEWLRRMGFRIQMTAYEIRDVLQRAKMYVEDGEFVTGTSVVEKSRVYRGQTHDETDPAFSKKHMDVDSGQFNFNVERRQRSRAQRINLSKNESSILRDEAKKAGLNETEVLARARAQKANYPVKEGWQPLEVIGLEVKNKDAGTFSIRYKNIPYEFNKRKSENRARNQDPELARRIANKLVKDVQRIVERANAGDPDAAVILRQAEWYEAIITRLRGEFGGFSDIFADLLGATSPNTPVADNWSNTVDILRRFVRGDFDAQLEALETWIDEGGTVAEFKQQLPDQLITKISGKKYGMNSDKAMKALLGMWRAVRAGDAPKARNFAMNLIGQSEVATVDVWAARNLQRLAGYKRIPPLAEQAVSGAITQDMRPGGQFGFGQDVFDIASETLRELGFEINSRSLQAVAWFLEKEIWAKAGWTNRSGEGGSFEQQMDAMPTQNWQAGYSITQTEPPSNASMAREISRIEPVLAPDENVFLYRIIPTQGLYAGDGERAFDHEIVAHPDWDPSTWIRALAEGGQANNQLDVFVSNKITDDSKDVPNARPGMEVFFREPLDSESAQRVMSAVREQGVDGFTLTVSPLQRRARGDGSEPGEYTGFRVQYVPEIAIRAYEYGWSDSSDPAVQAEYEALTSGDFSRVQDVFSSQLDSMVDAVEATRELPEVAYAETYRYDTTVFGIESYDEIIRGSQAANRSFGEEKSEQQVAAGLAQTAQRIRGFQGQDREGSVSERESSGAGDAAFSRAGDLELQFNDQERSVGPTGFERGTGGTDSAAQGVGQEESAGDLRRVAEENKRSDVTQGESLEGDGRGFTDFFRAVTTGADPTFQPVSPYKPAIPLTPRVQSFKEARAQYRGNFDDHIATSIPGFDEVQSIVGQAIVDTFDGENASVLDVGTSEGALIKAISDSSDGRISTLGIDPNPAMEDSFSSLPQSGGASFSLSAFGSAKEAGKVAWTEDDGTDIPFFDPQGQRFDVVHEAMVFQFISNARNAQVSRVKELMKPGGIAIFEQKFGDIATRSDAAEDQKDFEWKSEFYTKEQIEAKRRAVLQRGGDDVEGMNSLMVAHWEMEEVLTNNFAHVAQFWESGNFRGYVASDNRAVLEAFLGNMQDTDTRFARNQMPREVTAGDDAAFMRDDNDPDLDEARRRAGLGARRSAIHDWVQGLQAITHAKARDYTRELGHAMAQGAFDRFHGIKRIEQETVGNLPAEQSAYVAARLSTGIATTMRAILHYGAPQWRDGVISRVDDSEGLLQILEPVRGDIDTFLGWMVARRASRLYDEGRENLFEPKHIDALLQAGEASPRFDQFETVAARLDDFKKSVLDVAEQAGLIDPDARAAWDMSDYIPFYRMAEEAPGATGPRSRRGLSGQSSGIRTLRGGVDRLNDPLENLIMNFTHLMDASMKNHAILQLTENLDGFQGILEEVGPDFKQEMIPMEQVRERIIRSGGDPSLIPEESMQGLAKMYAMKPPSDEDVIRVMSNGKAKYYKVLDPMLLKSLTAMHDTGLGFIGIGAMRWTKRLLTRGVTADPAFMARNYIRDMMHAWTINEDKYRLGIDSLRGAAKTLSETGGTIDMMFAGGSFLGGYVNATDPNEVARATRQALRQKGFNAASSSEFLSTIIDTPLKLWEHYTRAGDAIENSSREATYEAAITAGRPRAEAIFQAKDLMDYSMRGSNRVMEFFTDVVPFLNARVQGLYKLGRAGGINPKKVFARGSMIMLGTLALLYDNEDDERYQQLPDWDKDTYWHIFPPKVLGDSVPHIRIPKPFEIGVLFGTIPERIAQRAMDNEGTDKTFERLLWGVNQTFAFNPVPQAVFPALETFANRDTFRDAPIENMADEGKRPEARFSASTSPTAREIGQRTGETLGISPKELEHLWRGYTGSLGMYALDVTDIAVRSWQGDPRQPSRRFDQLPVVRAFVRSEPALSTQMQTEFYDLYARARQDQRTINAYEKEGDIDKAVEIAQESERLLSILPNMRRTASDLSEIRQEINAIYNSKDMTPSEKREGIDELISLRNEITRTQVPEFKAFIEEDPLNE